MALRRRLGGHPDRSGSEAGTAAIVQAYLEDHGVAVETGVGGHGLLVRLGDGPARLLRAELDALPHADGARHGCGHDGHMAMLAAALVRLADDPPRPLLGLFQPSEEDGSGMARCLADRRLRDAQVTEAFALHNLPGHDLGEVVTRPGALASTGLRIRLTGREAHAASPSSGQSPYRALRRLADAVADLPTGLGPHALATLIHLRLGDEAYGTSPGHGVVAATLRGEDGDVEVMRARWIEELPDDLRHVVEEVDPFPETRNDDEANRRAAGAARRAGLSHAAIDAPWAWSEDFGHAVAKWGGALVGLGSGTDQPPLHDDAYVFPDDLVSAGAAFWQALAEAP